MALANKVGNYAGGQEAIGPDVEATFDSLVARVNAITLEQQTSDNVGTDQIIDGNVTLAKLLAGLFTADAAGRAKFAASFVDRSLQTNEAKGAGSYVLYQHINASGASAGTSVVGWNTQPIDTLVTDAESIGAGSPSSSQFTLPTGTYLASINCVHGFGARNGRLRLRNITDATNDLLGLVYHSNGTSASVNMQLSGRVTIAATKTFEVQHYTSFAVTTTGLGTAISSGTNEIFCSAEFWKLGS